MLLLQRLAHRRHSSPGMLSRSVQSDSPSATSCPPLEQQASRGTVSPGSLKGTFPASNPSKSPNTSIHLSPACRDESCINPAPNAADESLPSCATAQLHQDGPFPLQGPAPSHLQSLSSSPNDSIWKEKSVPLQDRGAAPGGKLIRRVFPRLRKAAHFHQVLDCHTETGSKEGFNNTVVLCIRIYPATNVHPYTPGVLRLETSILEIAIDHI